MIEKILNKLLAHKVVLNCVRDPYLYRWYLIRTESVGVFIHKFIRSDEDRALHDHPWNFLVIPIWRGYKEWSYHKDCKLCKEIGRIPHVRIVRPILGTRFRPATYRHRVDLWGNKPAWSIFIRFKRVRDWGFWPKEGFMVWNKWWQKNCGDD